MVHVDGRIARSTKSRGLGLCSRLWLKRMRIRLLLIWRDSTLVLLSQIHELGGLMVDFNGRRASAMATV